MVCKAHIKAPNQQVHLHAQLWPIPCTWAYGLWTSPTCAVVFLCVPGSTWTTNHCSKDRSLDAGGSVTAPLPSSALVGNTWTSRLLTVEQRRARMHLCLCVSCVRAIQLWEIHFVLLSQPAAVGALWCPWKPYMHFHRRSQSHNTSTVYLGGPWPRDQLLWEMLHFSTVLPCSHNRILN